MGIVLEGVSFCGEKGEKEPLLPEKGHAVFFYASVASWSSISTEQAGHIVHGSSCACQ